MLDWNRQELAEGLRCYRAEEFFAAHEHWEVVWLELEQPEKNLLQGLIQMAGAFHHLQRGNVRGALSLLGKAQARFQLCDDFAAGIDLSQMRKEVSACLNDLETAATSNRLVFPQIVVLH